jgi:hypothetical protein
MGAAGFPSFGGVPRSGGVVGNLSEVLLGQNGDGRLCEKVYAFGGSR